MLRYETKVVKIYFFAFKLTRKKKTSSQTGTTPYTSLWSKIYIRYANRSPSIPYLKPQLLNVRSKRHRRNPCLLSMDTEKTQAGNTTTVSCGYPIPPSPKSRDKPYPNRPKEYRTLFRLFSQKPFQHSTGSS